MVNLIKDDAGCIIGWSMTPSNKKEQAIVASIRDLQFFGYDDTQIVYGGLKLIDEDKGKSTGNIQSLSWIQKKNRDV